MKQVEQAVVDRDVGMSRALAGAEFKYEAWSGAALEFVRKFVRERRRMGLPMFMTEDIRAASIRWGLPDGGKAWGPIMRAAAREGIIVKHGYGPAVTSNLSPKVMWRCA